MKTKNLLILSTALVSLSACNSGGGSSADSQTNQTSSISTKWINVGGKAPNFIGGSNSIIYDKKNNSFFGVVRDSNGFSNLCSISANATPTDSWKCNVSLPDGYSVLHEPRDTIIGDNNGHLYIYGINIPIKNENINNRYVLKYNINTSNWESAVQITYPTGMLEPWLPYHPMFISDMLIGVDINNPNDLATIDLSTGTISTESNFYNPKIYGAQTIANMTNLYYNNDDQLYTKSLISKGAVAQKVGAQQSAYYIGDLYADKENLYTCGSHNISYLPIGATESTPWQELPPTSIYTYYNNNGNELKETTSCDNIFANDNTIYAYAEVFESINQDSKVSTRLQLIKYQR